MQIRDQRACGMRCHGPAEQTSLSGTERESQFLLNGQLHGWMSPGGGERGEREGMKRRRRGSKCGGGGKDRCKWEGEGWRGRWWTKKV